MASRLMQSLCRSAVSVLPLARLAPAQRRPASLVLGFSSFSTPATPPAPAQTKEKLYVHYILANGAKKTCVAELGDNLMDLAVENNIDIEEFFKKLPKPDEEELDMLDLAFGLTECSRLGCQIKMTPELNNIIVAVPEEQRDARG